MDAWIILKQLLQRIDIHAQTAAQNGYKHMFKGDLIHRGPKFTGVVYLLKRY